MNNFSSTLIVVIVGLLGGVAVGLQGPMSGAMSQRLGPLGSSLIIHTGGALFTGLFLLFMGGVGLSEVKKLPLPYFFAGLLGVLLYLTFSYTLPRVGVGMTTALLILAQMSIGLLLDHFGWLGVPQNSINWVRLSGVGTLLLGAYLISK
ncbi:MAG: DMT family transporter [Anaerolineales bacterium]|nr:DMT family transporter [Anaerolineales bacterium]